MDTKLLYKELQAINKKLDEIQSAQAKLITPWLTSREACAYLRCSASKLENLTSAGMIPFRRLDPRFEQSPRLYHRKDLVKYLVSGRNLTSKTLTAQERRIVEELV